MITVRSLMNVEERVTSDLRDLIRTGTLAREAVDEILDGLTEDEKDELLYPVLITKADRIKADLEVKAVWPSFTATDKATSGSVPVTPADTSSTKVRAFVRSKEQAALKAYVEGRLPSERATAYYNVTSTSFDVNGVKVPWSHADAAQHKAKVNELAKQKNGLDDSIKLHDFAASDIEKTPGATCIEDVLDYYFNPVGNKAGYKV